MHLNKMIHHNLVILFHCSWAMTLLAFMSPALVSAQKPLVLTQNGQGRCVIVLGDSPSVAAKDAARELQQTIRTMSGAAVSIKREQDIGNTTAETVHVLVGDSRAAKEVGLESRHLPPEGLVIKTVGSHLVLLGSDIAPNGRPTDGTFFAVATFEEEILGCRWLWPGDSGTVIPRKKTIAVSANLDIRQSPRLIMRRIRNCLGNGWYLTDEVKKRLDFSMTDYARMTEESELWLRRQKLGASVNLGTAHAYENWYDLYHDDHPEYFAMQLDGTRRWDPSWLRRDFAKLCVSNPVVVQKIIDDALTSIHQAGKRPVEKLLPGLKHSATPRDAISIGHNDGGQSGFCLCDNCKALDVPEAPARFKLRYPTGTIDYPALSDRYMIFNNKLAEGITKHFPDMYLLAFAYGATTPPPVKVKAHPNVVIQYVGPDTFPDSPYIWSPYDSEVDWKTQRAEWDAWLQSNAKLSWRPNWLRASLGMLMLYPHKVALDIRYFADSGLIGTDFDTMMNDWGSQGLNYYVIAKLLWDPDGDVDQIIEDYCQHGFGPGAGDVMAFFNHIEQMTLERARQWDKPKPWINPEMIAFFANEEFLSKADLHLERALAKIKNMPELPERIQFLADAVEFTRLRSNVIKRVLEYEKSEDVDLKALKALTSRHNLFLKTNKSSFSINTAYAMYDQIYKSRYFSPENIKRAIP
jgi:hypothetical protein